MRFFFYPLMYADFTVMWIRLGGWVCFICMFTSRMEFSWQALDVDELNYTPCCYCTALYVQTATGILNSHTGILNSHQSLLSVTTQNLNWYLLICNQSLARFFFCDWVLENINFFVFKLKNCALTCIYLTLILSK